MVHFIRLVGLSLQHALHDYSLSGALGVVGMAPAMLAVAADANEAANVPIPVWAASIVLGGVLALIGYLLQRGVSNLDTQLTNLSTKLDAQAKEHLAMLAEHAKEHAAKLAEVDKAQQKLRERVLRVETRCALNGHTPDEE